MPFAPAIFGAGYVVAVRGHSRLRAILGLLNFVGNLTAVCLDDLTGKWEKPGTPHEQEFAMQNGLSARSLRFFGLLTFWFGFLAMTFAQNGLPPGLVGQIGGPVQAVAVSGDRVYAGIGLRMVVLSAATLEETGATRPFPQFIEDIAVEGGRAYLAAGGAGLRIVDVSDPTRPVEIGVWDSPGYAEGVAVSGNVVYLADGPLGLRILDVSNPALPVELASAYVMQNVCKVALTGGYAYLAAGGSGLLVVEVTDPRRPVETAVLDTPGHAYHVAIKADKAYIADGWQGVLVAGIADPSHPVPVGSAPTNGWAMHLCVSHGRALVANSGFGLLVLDLADPSHPIEVASWDETPIAAIRVAALGDVAYIADRDWGVRAVDLADPSAPHLSAGYPTVTGVQSVAVQGHYAYAGAGFSGVQVVDIADPSRPVRVGGWASGANIPSVRVRGSFLYVASWGEEKSGLCILDVSDPTGPREVGFFLMRATGMKYMPGRPEDGEGPPRDLEIEGDVVYIANERGLLLVGVADPANPVYLGHINFTGWQTGGAQSEEVAVGGGYAFIPNQHELVVINVSDPRQPSIAAVLDTGQVGSEGLALYSNYLFMCHQDSENALWVVDVSDPGHPRYVGGYKMAVQPFRMTAANNELYVGARGAGALVLDLKNPVSPVFAGEADTPGLAHEVAATNDLLVVADDSGGLLLFDRRALRDGAATTATIEPLRERRSSRTTVAAPQWMTPLARNAIAKPSRAGFRAAGQTCVVTVTADSGTGSLRACMEAAAPGGTITFSAEVFAPDNPATIRLAKQLPPMSQGGVTIDASDAGVILDGADIQLVDDMPGLSIKSNDNVVRGLAFVHFPGEAAFIYEGARNVIGGNRLRGAGPSGQGNRFSSSRGGLNLEFAEDNVVSGNLFGVDAQGLALESNRIGCLYLGSTSRRNRIGGAAAGEGNLLSGCGTIALSMGGAGTEDNLVIGNWMNTDITGLRPLGTGGGLYLGHGASFNQIGGTGPGEGNVVSGGSYGVYLSDNGTRGNRVLGNLIGTNADATAAIPNAGPGVNIEAAVSHTLVEGNLFYNSGVSFVGWHDYFNSIVGNRFVRARVYVSLGAGYARIGGNTFEQTKGGAIWMGGANECIIVGNRTGIDPLADASSSGVSLGQGARHNIIGGPQLDRRSTARSRRVRPSAGLEESNLLSGTASGGVFLGGVGVEYNVIQGNRIGVDESGRLPIPNRSDGIALIDGAAHNFVQGNTVAFNAWAGVQVGGPENLLRRNSIHHNGGKGVQTLGSGAVLSAPVLAERISTRITGMTCPGCTVEIYSDDGEEGELYEGAALADGRGAFTFEKASGLRGPNVQAIASSAKGTSQFSTCVQAVAPTSFTIPASGGTGSIVVTALDPCPWDMLAESWITLARSKTGVDFTVGANTDDRSRTGAIVIGGQIVVVTQRAP